MREFFGKDEITDEDLEKGCTLDYRVKLDNETHEEAVVKHLVTEEDFANFIKRYLAGTIATDLTRWRQHFLTFMKPQYLPTGSLFLLPI